MTADTYPLVTIAIPTYKRADGFLKEAIRSASNQTYPNIEIIVSDNCSSDNTEIVVKSYNDSRIRYYKQAENIGANNNFNFCLKQAKGSYFLLLQDDDLIDSDFIDVCMRAAEYETGIGIIRTGTRLIDSQGKVLSERPNMVGRLSTENFFRGWFSGKTALYLCSTLFNTERLRDIAGFRSKHNLFQDVIAEVQLAARFGRVDVQDVKASFRKHSMEMTFAAKVNDWCEDSLMLLDLMCELSSENKEIIKNEGMRFFSRVNYGRAKAVKSPFRRFSAYLNVFKKFNYCYLPSIDHFIHPVYRMLYGTSLYYGLRSIKRRFKQI
jgi:glycosyltransferase involved in cell wall biosynthesis